MSEHIELLLILGRRSIATAMLVIWAVFAAAPVQADPAPARGPSLAWVEVTRPMISCWTIAHDEQPAIDRLLAAAPSWRAGRKPPKGCEVLKRGARYILSKDQPKTAVKLMDYCVPGCSPYLWPTFAPLEAKVGAYLKPSSRPKAVAGYLN
jgi:hypothetical protein